MSVIIDLPDGAGSVTAHNAAEESTLRDIHRLLLAQATGQKIDASSIKAVGEHSKVASRGLLGLGSSLSDAKDASDNYARSVRESSQTFVRETSTIFSSFSKVGAAGSSFADSVEGLANMAAKIADKLPYIGAIAGATISGFAAILSETGGNFQKMQQSGASFGYSMLETRQIANEAGLSLGMLSNVVNKARADLVMFGGTTSAGGRIFADLNKKIQQGDIGSDLLRMGIGFEEQSEMLAEVMGDFVRAGVDVRNLGQHSEGVTRTLATLAIQQKKLAQFNGITLEQQREEMKMQKNNAQLQVSIAHLDVEHRKAAEGFATQFKKMGPVAEQAWLEVMAHGRAVNDTTSIFLHQFPDIGDAMKGYRSGILGGTIGLKDVSAEWGELAKSPALKNSLENAGALVKASMAANIPGAQEIAAVWVNIRDLVEKGGIEVAEAISVDGKKLGAPMDETTALVVSSMKLAKQVQESLSTLATVALESTVMTGIMESITKFNDDVQKAQSVALDHLRGKTSGKSFEEAWSKLIEKGNNVAKMFDLLATSVGTVAKLLGVDTEAESRQHGGPVKAGSSYKVHENEIFIPKTDGFVMPDPALRFQKAKQTANILDKNQLGTPISAIEKMIEQAKKEVEIEQYGQAVSQPADVTMQKTQVELSRDIEEAIKALPALLMDNTNAINKANVDTADGLYDLRTVVA